MATESFAENVSIKSDQPKIDTGEIVARVRKAGVSPTTNDNGGVTKIQSWVIGVLMTAVLGLGAGWGTHIHDQMYEDRQANRVQFSEINNKLEVLRSKFDDQISGVKSRLQAQARMEADIEYIKQTIAEVRTDLKSIKANGNGS